MSLLSDMRKKMTGNKSNSGLAKTSRHASTITGQAGIATKNYSGLYRLHARNVDVRRVIQEKQNAIGQKWYLTKGRDEIEQDEAQYTEIDNVLNNKNIEGLDRDFDLIKNKIIKDINITGNAYIYLARNEAGKVIGLQCLDPRYCSIVADSYGRILGYAYRIAGAVEYYTARDVVHLRDGIDDENELYGTSILEALQYDLLADEYAAINNKVRFENMNVPSQLIILEDGLSDDTIEEIITNMHHFFSGAGNSHRAAVAKGIKEIIPVQNISKDMEFITLRKFTTEKICAAFGVPKIILGHTDGINHSNAETLYRQYIETTILPEEKKIAYYINQIVQQINPAITFHYRSDHLDKLQQMIDIYTKAIENGIMTIDEIRVAIGKTPFDTEISSQPMIKNSLLLLDNIQLQGYSFNIDENQGA